MSLTQQTPEDGTIVCVLKSSSNDAAYRNRSDIVHQLHPPYKFPQHFEVGLRRVTYFPNKRETVNVAKREQRKITRVVKKTMKFHEKPPPPGPIFPGWQQPQLVKRVAIIKKDRETFVPFVNRFNSSTELGPQFRASLSWTGTSEGRVFKVKYEPSDPAEVLLLSSHLATLLGFRRNQFTAGTHVASQVVNDEQFTRLDVNTDLTVTAARFPYKDSMITLQQLFNAPVLVKKDARKTYTAFFDDVSQQMANNGFKVVFSFDSQKKVTMTVQDAD